MGIRDYLIVLALMFINLVTTAFLAFQTTIVPFELGIVVVLLILDLLFVFGQKLKLAVAFFIVSLLNMGLLFAYRPDFIYALLFIIDILILYYLILFKEEKEFTQTADETSEDLFSELGLPTIEQIATNDVSVILPEQTPERTTQTIEDTDDFFVATKPNLQTYEEFDKTRQKQDEYVHIEELGLPEAEERTPQKKYTYSLYYEEPRQELTFQPIEVLEKKIEQKVKRAVKRKRAKKKR